ncbi:Antagonist of MEN (Mitotic Exit Network) [Podila minutissima]|uniref:Antagonist of MEN (Mitotic Exit Network) n=1 Tax=Podila minutissima TaxID=64525 RepID=A0A9P5SHK0_9FUNG|nr:Antagonist of MEN (Mitotic Exit Network) [Podila minutissima]
MVPNRTDATTITLLMHGHSLMFRDRLHFAITNGHSDRDQVWEGTGANSSEASSSPSPQSSASSGSEDQETDESNSSGECECNCGDERKGYHLRSSTTQQQPVSTRSTKKRSNSTVTTSSVTSNSSGHKEHKGRTGRASSVSGVSIRLNMTGCSSAGIGNRRSSVTSSIAGESVHNYNIFQDKTRSTFNATQYRQHFTGHGAMPPQPPQHDAIKRRLSFFKAVTSGGSSSRRGSVFSTKSQETAVNLTGINPADDCDEYEDDEEDDDYHLDDDNYDYEDDEEGEYYNTNDAMLTSEVEFEIYRRRQERCYEIKRRRQSLLSNTSLRGSIFPRPLFEYQQRPSPIQLPEILHLIFQFLVDETPAEDYSQREIYNCLLVSKQWYLVAQKTLWREIRFKNLIKLELFVDLLKRTDTVECLGIERNKQVVEPAYTVAPVRTVGQSAMALITKRRSSVAKSTTREESIAAPSAMQKRLYERASCVKKIVLHKLKTLEDQDIMPLASWFHNLQVVEFYICEKLTDSIVVAIAENCPQLQHLLMPGCAKVTDVGIGKIALNCPRMKHLDLRACSAVSDESLILVAKNCKDLWHLNVGRVTASSKVTGASIVEIAKNTNLNTLGLAGCAMSDDAVIEIARYSRGGLHRISLNSCSMLTSASVKALMQMCPNLAVLEIKQCHLVTDMATLYRFASRRVLVELCPVLQKRLVEYKVELAAMNASIQSNNITATTTNNNIFTNESTTTTTDMTMTTTQQTTTTVTSQEQEE